MMTATERTLLNRISSAYEEKADRLFGETLVCATLKQYPETVACRDASRAARFIARVFSDRETP